jgi:hypothetical protein
MSLPNITEASEQTLIRNGLTGQLGEAVPIGSVFDSVAQSLARSVVGAYRFVAARWLDQFARHASTEPVTVLGRTFTPLVEIGRLVGVGDPMPATRAQLKVTVHVTTVGGILEAGTILEGDNGFTYSVESDVELDTLAPDATIRAVEDPDGNGGYGSAGTLQTNSELRFLAAPDGLQGDATVTSVLTPGTDVEPWARYRKRVVDARRTPRRGAAYSDYRATCRTVPGIDEAFVYSYSLPGVVVIYLRATPETCGNEDGIPTVAQRHAVENILGGLIPGTRAKFPLAGAFGVLPITRRPFDLEVRGLQATDTTAAHTAIEKACREFLVTREPFIVGQSELPRIDRITRGELGRVVSQTVLAMGGSVRECVPYDAGEDFSARTLERGEHAKLGSISYTS